mmetsp:Transcript_75557/g.219467  ORF Transcript_75557/g.219467 Transcript_75557/m.219467 type:complete len:262 (-) Transcript_75557:129-914(-)
MDEGLHGHAVVLVDGAYEPPTTVQHQELQVHGNLGAGLAPRHASTVPRIRQRLAVASRLGDTEGGTPDRLCGEVAEDAFGAPTTEGGGPLIVWSFRTQRACARAAHGGRRALGVRATCGHLAIVKVLQNRPLALAKSFFSLLLFCALPVLGGACVEQLWVLLHEHLQHLECPAMHRALPMLGGIVIQGAYNGWKLVPAVLHEQLYKPVAPPHRERFLSDVGIRKRHTFSQSSAELVLQSLEVSNWHDEDEVLDLRQEKNLL